MAPELVEEGRRGAVIDSGSGAFDAALDNVAGQPGGTGLKMNIHEYQAKSLLRDFGVSVLRGSVRQAGRRLRANVQLVDARSGRNLWAEQFDGQFGEDFDGDAFGSGVADAVAGAERRVVTVGFSDDMHAEIVSGVRDGEEVVVKGQRSL